MCARRTANTVKIVANDSRIRGSDPTFPLSAAAVGDRLRIESLTAGKTLARRLADLGLPVGSEIEVVHRQPGGRMVVAREFARVALGAGMTERILVRRAEGGG
jgi:ferrous iron transport protein A